jgi:hypothetical protein
MKKRKRRKFPYKVTEEEVQEALWFWYSQINCTHSKRLTLDGFVGNNFCHNRWGWRANATGRRRLEIVLSPHARTLLKAYALRHNKKLLLERLQ